MTAGWLRLWPAVSSPLPSTPFASIILVTSLVAIFAAIDFIVPGEVDVAILYGLCVGLCAWSRSPRFLWAIAAACVILTFAGLTFGPAPITGDSALRLFWIDRTIVAVKLLVLAACVHLWIQRWEWLRASSTLMRERNDTLSENLRQSQKMEAIGQLTEGIAHDFKNILTVIIGNLELIAADRGDEARRRHSARAVLRSAESATGLVQRLLAFSRPQTRATQVVHVDAITRRMLPLWRHSLGEAIDLIADLARGLWPCRLDPAQFEAAILNLIANAKDAMPDGGRITIRAENTTVAPGMAIGLSAGDYILVSVSDDGPGITGDVLPQRLSIPSSRRRRRAKAAASACGWSAASPINLAVRFASRAPLALGRRSVSTCQGPQSTNPRTLPETISARLRQAKLRRRRP